MLGATAVFRILNLKLAAFKKTVVK